MQTLRRGLNGLNRALQARPWLLIPAVGLIYGFGHTDFKDFQLLTRNPFETLQDGGRQFLHSSPLTIFLGWPLTSLAGGHVAYFTVGLGGFACLAAAVAAFLGRLPTGRRATAGLVLLSSPLLLVLLHWIGKGDTYLIAFYLATLLVRDRPWPTLLLCALMVAAHREIGTVILLGDLVLRRGSAPAVVGGGLLGHALVGAYLASLTPKPQDRIDFALALMLHGRTWRENPVTHLVLGPGWLWMILARLAGGGDGWRMAAVLALDFAAAANTADFTRDFILCCTPLVAHAAERMARETAAGDAVLRWPALFLIQAQIASGNQVVDTEWTR